MGRQIHKDRRETMRTLVRVIHCKDPKQILGLLQDEEEQRDEKGDWQRLALALGDHQAAEKMRQLQVAEAFLRRTRA